MTEHDLVSNMSPDALALWNERNGITAATTAQLDAVAASRSRYRSKAEAAYADVLERNRLAGEIEGWHYEAMTFLLDEAGNNRKGCRFTPDFVVIPRGDFRMELHEVKGGFVREDALLKFRMARKLYPRFVWHMMQRAGKGGEFRDVTP